MRDDPHQSCLEPEVWTRPAVPAFATPPPLHAPDRHDDVAPPAQASFDWTDYTDPFIQILKDNYSIVAGRRARARRMALK